MTPSESNRLPTLIDSYMMEIVDPACHSPKAVREILERMNAEITGLLVGTAEVFRETLVKTAPLLALIGGPKVIEKAADGSRGISGAIDAMNSVALVIDPNVLQTAIKVTVKLRNDKRRADLTLVENDLSKTMNEKLHGKDATYPAGDLRA